MLHKPPTQADADLSRAVNDELRAEDLEVSPRQIRRWHEYGALTSEYRSMGRRGRISNYSHDSVRVAAEIARQLVRWRRLDVAVFLAFLAGYSIPVPTLRRALGRISDTPVGNPPSDEEERWDVADRLANQFVGDRGSANSHLRAAMKLSGIRGTRGFAKDLFLTVFGDPLIPDPESKAAPDVLNFLGLSSLWADDREAAVDGVTDIMNKLTELGGIDTFIARATSQDFEEARKETVAAVEAMPVLGGQPPGLLGMFVAAVEAAVVIREGGTVF